MATAHRRIAVVTGGTGGLGEAICRHLSDAGFDVAALHTAGNTGVGRWLAAHEAKGYRFAAEPVDVASFDSCAQAVASLRHRLGPVAVLVNNAGITRDATLRKMKREDWDAVLRVDLDSLFNMSKAVIEDMAAAGWGRIVNISSVNGQRGAYGQTNYAAAKAGIHGFTKSLALELAKTGITVNTVSPGYLRTRMVEAVPEQVLRERILPQIPLGRLGEPDEVAALVAYLASEQAAFITGADFAINGGMHME